MLGLCGLGPLSGRHSPDVAGKLSTILTNLTGSAGKEDPAPLRLPMGAGRGHCGEMFLSTLCLEEWSVRNWVMSSVDVMQLSTRQRLVPTTSQHNECGS